MLSLLLPLFSICNQKDFRYYIREVDISKPYYETECHNVFLTKFDNAGVLWIDCPAFGHGDALPTMNNINETMTILLEDLRSHNSSDDYLLCELLIKDNDKILYISIYDVNSDNDL